MRGLKIDALLRFRIHPAAENAAARKYERVHAIIIDDGKLKVTIKRRGGYGLPLHNQIICSCKPSVFDLDQVS